MRARTDDETTSDLDELVEVAAEAHRLRPAANGAIGREYGVFPIPMLKRNIDNVPEWDLS